MKSTTYFAKITTKKAEKYLFERGKLESTCLLAYLPRVNIVYRNIWLGNTIAIFVI